MGRIEETFTRWTGRLPAEVWTAPGRVNLIGEHTDYSGGFVLPIALDRWTTVAVVARDDGELRCRSLQFEDATGWAMYVEAVAKALAQHSGVNVRGADVLVDSNLRAGSGLSSSAALEVAAAAALAALAGQPLAAPDLAAIGHEAETEYVGVPTGVMDQTVVALARAGHALFLDTRSLESEDVPFDPREHGLSLLVIDSGVRRRLDDGRYAERRKETERAAEAMGVPQLRDATLEDVERAPLDDTLRRRARHVVTENARVLEAVRLLRSGDMAALGPILLASHASLRDDFAVSVPALDEVVDVAIANGALGARMTGGGFGGSALALVPDAALVAVTEAFGGSAFAARAVHGVRRVGPVR
jgi:galactokinase